MPSLTLKRGVGSPKKQVCPTLCGALRSNALFEAALKDLEQPQRRKQRKKATTARKVAEATATAAADDDHQLPPPPVRRREEEPSSLEQILEEDEELEALEEEAAVVELPKSDGFAADVPEPDDVEVNADAERHAQRERAAQPEGKQARALPHQARVQAVRASHVSNPSSSCNAMTHGLGAAAQAAAPDSDPSGTWLKPRAARRRRRVSSALAARRRRRVSGTVAAR